MMTSYKNEFMFVQGVKYCLYMHLHSSISIHEFIFLFSSEVYKKGIVFSYCFFREF